MSKILGVRSILAVINRDAGALVGQGGEEKNKGTCEPRQAEKWGVRVHPGKFVGATPF